MKIGFVGLGKMGVGLVLSMREKGIEVLAWNRSPSEVANVGSVEEMIRQLEPGKRVIWLMLPAGRVVDEMITRICPLLNKGDLVIDGGNSFYQDDLRRAAELAPKGIEYMDIGVSGGPKGAREGACLMIGGNRTKYEEMREVWQAIAARDSYEHLGKTGAGHFAKMVHNGIEYGMMQAIAEGVAVLNASNFNFDLAKVLELYNHNSVIASRLVGWTAEALKDDPQLDHISSKIEHTGEGEWTINTAKESGISVPVIAESLAVRKRSRSESNNFSDKTVSAMRGKFGGHKVTK
ncbi:MAG: 6-phosphogluconate dehydrogenase, decarboxylating [Microgenomates group bacterium GW2011_GWA2_46_7]|nr:MAG: 6-phosphogluconate dehydrogenase, decarboxylating [Microgenomates group bacterium GW2011_GWA2_46_7]KKU46593.1 MAG: 6-phosphogluconate dehydrogenase, decarboxylating [Microgenomates group bacterium GW2011_GWC2_46_7]